MKPAFELGLLGGYAWTDEACVAWYEQGHENEGQCKESTDFNDWTYGIYAGVNARSGSYGFGAEVDAMRWASESDLADWLMSVRGRGGFYVADNLMAYGTAGWAWETDQGDNGLVWGAGIQMETGRVTTRVEWLNYDLETDVQMVRVGAGLKF
jgi:hypothetical protein